MLHPSLSFKFPAQHPDWCNYEYGLLKTLGSQFSGLLMYLTSAYDVQIIISDSQHAQCGIHYMSSKWVELKIIVSTRGDITQFQEVIFIKTTLLFSFIMCRQQYWTLNNNRMVVDSCCLWFNCIYIYTAHFPFDLLTGHHSLSVWHCCMKWEGQNSSILSLLIECGCLLAPWNWRRQYLDW